ncbi:substrate-binding domain-containing protein [Pseudobacteroides cellulosolvens]|uniref:DNA binding domain protein, excisionase family n=1 Tax=Pseudobacteroides cellulosolvens ATCC 35603 = DSM 2933 TaxID=398512 RepID=A0A0L6JH36_9FIRM|nr:helix-turn-helix transcriptional regulator [Pseudobacteroides cellulosolvens]KNY25171.1 DNA binding domain protein, excisionase family [Pseudobacteroides cellulosolvens ATCC 35603 = DSM 2933]
MNDNSALTPQEVADILKISKNTVYELIKRGELNSYRVGKKVRVDSKDVESYKNKSKSIKNEDQSGLISERLKSYNPLNDELPKINGFVICGQDILLDILSRYLQLHPNGIQALRSYVGSYNGLYELYQGNVQLATAHLWDGDTGQYNIPYVRRMLPGIPAVIIHLACRLQGFYVAYGNPKNIKGWEDLKRKDITIINREKGSGTRVLLDEHIRKLCIPSYNIKGYNRESTSHLAIASTVARGGADLGLGNEKSGLQVKGIEFIPLQTERYEMVIKKEDMEKAPFKAVLEILRSQELKMELEGIGGYDLTEIGQIVAET